MKYDYNEQLSKFVACLKNKNIQKAIKSAGMFNDMEALGQAMLSLKDNDIKLEINNDTQNNILFKSAVRLSFKMNGLASKSQKYNLSKSENVASILGAEYILLKGLRHIELSDADAFKQVEPIRNRLVFEYLQTYLDYSKQMGRDFTGVELIAGKFYDKDKNLITKDEDLKCAKMFYTYEVLLNNLDTSKKSFKNEACSRVSKLWVNPENNTKTMRNVIDDSIGQICKDLSKSYVDIKVETIPTVRKKRFNQVKETPIPSYVDFLLPEQPTKTSFQRYLDTPSYKYNNTRFDDENSFNDFVNSEAFKTYVAYLETPVDLNKTKINKKDLVEIDGKFYPKEVVILPKKTIKNIKNAPESVILVSEESSNKANKKSYKKIIIGGIVVLLIAGASLGIAKHIKDKSKEPGTIQTDPNKENETDPNKEKETGMDYSDFNGEFVTEEASTDIDLGDVGDVEEKLVPVTPAVTAEEDEEDETASVPHKNNIHGGSSEVVPSETETQIEEETKETETQTEKETKETATQTEKETKEAETQTEKETENSKTGEFADDDENAFWDWQ